MRTEHRPAATPAGTLSGRQPPFTGRPPLATTRLSQREEAPPRSPAGPVGTLQMSATRTDPAFVRFAGVQKTYDGVTLVVENLDLEIARGEFLTLLGPSGSG